MNSKFNTLKTAFFALVSYEIFSLFFLFDGLSISKLIITALVWVSFIVALYGFFKNYSKLKKDIPHFSFILLKLIIVWNIIGIVRSLMGENGSITTLFGNVFTGLALLLPFVISFYIQGINIKLINSYLINLLKIGILLFLIFLVLNGISPSEIQIKLLLLLFAPTIFLLTVLPFQTTKGKLIIWVSIFLLFYLAYLWKSRTMMIRIPLLFTGLIVIGFYRSIFFKLILRYSFLLLFLPFFLLQNSYESGKSFFDKDISNVTSDEELSIDSRTFLYQEVYADLIKNEQILFGKGAIGSYYSGYFEITGADNKNRLTVEVGILALLLKGGVVSVILNLLLLFISIYLSFFKTKNTYVIGVGFILLTHILLLFVENLVGFNVYNFLIWFFIGVCLSKELRGMNNFEIKKILTQKDI